MNSLEALKELKENIIKDLQIDYQEDSDFAKGFNRRLILLSRHSSG